MIRIFITLFAVCFSLQGCFFVAGAAAGAAGIAVIYDHRKLESIAEDQRIVNAIVNRISRTPELSESHIAVTCFNRIVLLTGQTPTAQLRQKADDIAHSVPNTARIINQLTVQGPTSSLTRTSDTWITTKIKTEMLATKDLKSGTIKVITENGTVYLLGVVTREQAEMAVDIARQVSGVQKVVKIFQYK
jgi:osmotically-inducible protein OsmY